MIITLKVTLLYGLNAKHPWEGSLELEEDTTLGELHDIIQRVVNFDDDHLYEFFIALTPTSRDQTCFDDENEKVYSTTIGSLFPLPKKRKLFYLFDYGDSWTFQIAKTRKKPFAAVDGVYYPRLLEEKGQKPEQYPGWDDDWEEE